MPSSPISTPPVHAIFGARLTSIEERLTQIEVWIRTHAPRIGEGGGEKGERGEKGEKGATGSTGATGPKGETGATGAKGEKGEPGETPAERGRSEPMVGGKITITAPATTGTNVIQPTAEGGIANIGALTITERKPGTGFVVESTLVTSTARVNWTVWN